MKGELTGIWCEACGRYRIAYRKRQHDNGTVERFCECGAAVEERPLPPGHAIMTGFSGEVVMSPAAQDAQALSEFLGTLRVKSGHMPPDEEATIAVAWIAARLND